MICESKFRPGDKVAVVKNTERALQESRIGMVGEVVGIRSRDCLVRFADGTVHAIFEEDLEIYNNECSVADKKVFFFCMTVCHHRTGEHIGKRCGVVLADSKEEAEHIAWDKYGNDSSYQLVVEEVTEDSYDFTVYRSEI